MKKIENLDEILATCTFFVLVPFLIYLDLFNVTYEFVRSHDDFGIAEIIIVLFLFSIITSLYAWKKNIDLKKHQKELISNFKHDKLTNLENREAMMEASDEVKDSYVVLINIIDFKTINKTLGFIESDKILVKISKELSDIVDSALSTKLYRLYGNEFGFLCPAFKDIQDVCYEIKSRFEDISIEHMNNDFTFSINMAYSNASPRLLNATMALEKSKKSLNPDIIEGSVGIDYHKNIETLNTLKLVKDAILTNRVVPVFQGIVDNKTGKIDKYETLVRIKKEDGTLLSPYFFIELSKKFKIYPCITKIVIEKAFEYFNGKDSNFSINFSYIDIHNEEVLSFFYDILEKNKETAKHLTIEILETENIANYTELIEFKHKIETYGCSLAIDDFGAGYSNLVAILKLKPDFIKIDGSLIENLFDENNISLVKTIVQFAKENNIKTVAEFVSSEELAVLVKELNIDYSQGYFYSQPEILS